MNQCDDGTRIQRVIIIDGPDCTGKSHIARALASELHVPYFKNGGEHVHFGKPDVGYFSNAARYIDMYMSAFLAETGTSVILDRAWPSEYCYPLVFGRNRDIDVLRELDRRWAKLGAQIVLTYRTSYDECVDEHHPHIKPEHLRQLDVLYEEFHHWSACDTLRLNVDDEDIEREVDDVLNFIGEPNVERRKR